MSEDQDKLYFANEAPLNQAESAQPWKILIVDDDDFVHKVTELALSDYQFEGRGLMYIHAYSAAQARDIIHEHPDIVVILLDVIMETGNAGLEFVRYVREEIHNKLVRIILRTGQPGQAPERQVIIEYDVNDYKHKAELSEQRLFTAITVAIRSYQGLRTIEESRLGLQSVISSSTDLFSTLSIDEYLPRAMECILQIGRCSGNSCLEQAVVAIHGGQEFEVQASLPVGLHQEASDLPMTRMLDLFALVTQTRQLAILDQEFAASFENIHTGHNYFFYASFGRPLTETEQGLLHILGGNISVALNNLFLNAEIISTQHEVVLTLGEVVESRSKETAQHVQRVAEYSYFLALKCGLSEERAKLLRMASPMHDVGKIGISDAILFKTGKLTPEEFTIIKTHTIIGHGILKNSKRQILRTAATIALQHHERWDGNGYPHGLAKDETHIHGRITALADVFDALSCDRVYKKAWPMEQVVAYIQEQRGKQFDPDLVDIFMDNLDEILAIRQRYPD